MGALPPLSPERCIQHRDSHHYKTSGSPVYVELGVTLVAPPATVRVILGTPVPEALVPRVEVYQDSFLTARAELSAK